MMQILVPIPYRNYQLSADDHFSLVIKEKLDGSKYPELVLLAQPFRQGRTRSPTT